MHRFLPRVTIERLRTLVLIGAAILVIAIAAFLGFGKWKRHFLTKDLPKRLGIDIEQQADGVNYTQSRKGKTLFKIHAARAVQMKSSGKTLLHDVQIDLYGEDGQRSDVISGSEFAYDPGAGVAKADGAVEITLMRPGVQPAIAQLKPGAAVKPMQLPGNSANGITDNQIHVKTSGLTFYQKSGVATTAQRVDFALRQGNGNSIGATYDSGKGQLILDHAVELHVDRATPKGNSGPVTVHATHAEFERGEYVCQLTQAQAEYAGGSAQSGNALIHFREDGSVVRLDGSEGVDLKTVTGSHVTAPQGMLDFDEHNHPQHGLLQGGARLETVGPDRSVQGAAPTARLTFDGEGQLRQAHLEQGVVFNTQQSIATAKRASGRVQRSWHSQTADVAFAPTVAAGSGKVKAKTDLSQSRVEPRTIHGFGGVVVTSETNVGGVVTPSRLAADTVVAELAPGSVLSTLSGTGHASFEERTAKGVYQSSSSDQLDVRFVQPVPPAERKASGEKKSEGSEIASVVQVGHVVLVQDAAAAKAGQAAQSPVRATASRADYDGASELLHLTGLPRMQDGSLDMTANTIDFARASGDAFAHGNVKASWVGKPGQASPLAGAGLVAGGGMGANGPVHAIAQEAELREGTQEVIFRAVDSSTRSGNKSGKLEMPRLWQAENSVSAPLITLNRQKQTLVAVGDSAANPVRTVLLSNSASNPTPGSGTKSAPTANGSAGKAASAARPEGPSLIRVRSGDLDYSEGERIAYFHASSLGSVTAETTGAGGESTVVSQQVQVKLLPAGVHAAKASANSANNGSIDQMTALGHVTVNWPDRQGTGEKLVYLSEDGSFTLTGTSAAPPRMTDQAKGTVTGSALIFHTGDDSVTVEGDGGKTVTDTQSQKKRRLGT